MSLTDISTVIKNVSKIATNTEITDEEKRHAVEDDYTIRTEMNLVPGNNISDSVTLKKSVYLAGWRPFIGWVGGLALAYQFILYPLLVWLWALLQAYDIIPCHLDSEYIKNTASVLAAAVEAGDATFRAFDLSQCSFQPPPTFDASILFTIVTGMLGIGGMRSYDKLKKTDTQKVGWLKKN